MLKRIPNFTRYIFSNIILLFIYTLLLRVVFYFFFADFSTASEADVTKALYLGIRFDIKLAVISMFPLAILIFIINNRFFKYKIYKKISLTYLMILYTTITLFYVFDFGNYSYLSSRLDATSLRFLEDLKISSQVLWESYPVIKGSICLLILLFILYKLLQFIFNRLAQQNSFLTKKVKAFYIVIPFFVLAFGIYNSTTHYPLRWSQAFFSKNSVVNQFALNPVLYFFDSFKFRTEGFDLEKTKAYYPLIAKTLNFPEESLQFKRAVTFDSITQQPNIVFVMLESVGAGAMRTFGNPINTTPKMDSIIKNSAFFSNFYVHKPGTAASVFASITGLPDVDAVRTASRNPLVIDQRIIYDQLKDYEKFYFLGGSANWANIRGVFQSNIQNLHVYEEGSYAIEKRADVWGMDDYELFKESDKILTEQHQKNKPFIAYIQTATNHMPFSVPDKKETFTPLKEGEISKETLKKGGFDSVDRLNALRYLDFNVARFLERAKTAGYYDNTIFVFFGDHNTHMTRFNHLGNEFDLNIEVHHVPMFIHAPKFVAAKKHVQYAKLVDLVPTAVSVAKQNYINYTLGTNILDTITTNDFSFLYHSIKGEPSISIIKDGYLYSHTNIHKKTFLYDLNAKTTEDIKLEKPEVSAKLDSMVKAYYNATKYLYYNNKKLTE